MSVKYFKIRIVRR